MYPHELDLACKSISDIFGVDKNSLGEVKYNQLKEYIEALAAVHYSKGHDDGYTLSAGYSRK
jgi:regulator of PEP synthase PpsR (kinase-PPPase family)